MIIVRLMGGLGNQLQQYALYQKFISLGKEVRLDTSWFEAESQRNALAPRKLELNFFEKADYLTATAEELSSVLGYDISNANSVKSKLSRALYRVTDKFSTDGPRKFVESGMYHPEIFEMNNICIEGYWASEKYYADILPIVVEKLAFTQINNENRVCAAEIAQKACDNIHTCSVHIRRGDYLDPENLAIFGNIATEKYYDAAFEYIRSKHPDAHFYIFSDDPEYVNSRYGNDPSCTFIDINHGNNSRYDMYLMSKCNSHICANSTFSFWGARFDTNRYSDSANTQLSGELIRPTIHKNSQVFDADQMHDLWKNWILISPDGKIK